MGFREVPVYEVKEVLRLWLRGEGLRTIERMADVNRKTVRRYVEAAVAVGVERTGSEAQLREEVLGAVLERVRPQRSDGRGESWHSLEAHAEQIKTWIDDEGLSVINIHALVAQRLLSQVWKGRDAVRRVGPFSSPARASGSPRTAAGRGS
jgi:hypothetical protein